MTVRIEPCLDKMIELGSSLREEQDLMKRGILTDKKTGKQFFTGYFYETLYDWDQFFEAILQLYMGWSDTYIANAVTIFLDHQRKDGFISRSIPAPELQCDEMIKPFLAQITNLLHVFTGDISWFTPAYYDKMKKALDWWLEQEDTNGSGLCEWKSAPHSGMDNQHERAGWWEDRISEGVDLNCYLVDECKAFARLATLLDQVEDARSYRDAAQRRAARINELLWDEQDGFYYDRHAKQGALIKVKSVSGFTPLWSGIASAAQADRLVKDHLTNPDEFWTTWPITTLSKSAKGYSPVLLENDLGCNWRAATWIPTNYMIYHGLKHYGFDDIAAELADKTHRLVKGHGNREWYDPETGQGQGCDPFWGWSLLGHFTKLEDELGVNVRGILALDA